MTSESKKHQLKKASLLQTPFLLKSRKHLKNLEQVEKTLLESQIAIYLIKVEISVKINKVQLESNQKIARTDKNLEIKSKL